MYGAYSSQLWGIVGICGMIEGAIVPLFKEHTKESNKHKQTQKSVTTIAPPQKRQNLCDKRRTTWPHTLGIAFPFGHALACICILSPRYLFLSRLTGNQSTFGLTFVVSLSTYGLKQQIVLCKIKLALQNKYFAVVFVRPVVETGQTGQYIVSAKAFERFLLAVFFRLSGSLVA